MSELKPCPFCGSKDIYVHPDRNYSDHESVECVKCGARIYYPYAKKRWNTRPESAWEIFRRLFIIGENIKCVMNIVKLRKLKLENKYHRPVLEVLQSLTEQAAIKIMQKIKKENKK